MIGVLESHRHKVGPFDVIVDPTVPNDKILFKYGGQTVGQIVNVRA